MIASLGIILICILKAEGYIKDARIYEMWFFLSLFFAFWNSIGAFVSKRILKTTDVLVYVTFGNIFVSLSMGIIIIFLGIPKLDIVFGVSVLSAALINIIATLAAFKAIKISPISLLAPLSVFNPLVVTLFGFLFLKETVNPLKLFGIIFIVIGAYLLNATDIKKGIFTPFIKLFGEKGVQLTLLANILWGITPIFEKTAIFHTFPSSPLMTTFGEGVFLSIFLLPLMLKRSKNPFSQFKQNLWWYIIPAPITALASWSAFTAFSLINVGYAAAVFKLSVFFTILLGAIFFKEKRIKERLFGGSIMILGTILLVV